jgi:hypothetical protein
MNTINEIFRQHHYYTDKTEHYPQTKIRSKQIQKKEETNEEILDEMFEEK